MKEENTTTDYSAQKVQPESIFCLYRCAFIVSEKMSLCRMTSMRSQQSPDFITLPRPSRAVVRHSCRHHQSTDAGVWTAVPNATLCITAQL